MSVHLILVTDDLENVCQGQNLQKEFNFDTQMFLKNSQRRISLTVISSQKYQMVAVNNHRRCFQQLFSVSYQFSGKVENKMFYGSLSLLIVKNV